MKHLSKVMLLAISISLLPICWGVYAQPAPSEGTSTEGPNIQTDKKPDEPEGMRILNMAVQLIDYARENESPETMLTAVQMLQRVQLKPAESETPATAAPSAGASEEQETGNPITLDPAELLKEAMAWAEEQDKGALKTLLEEQAAAKPISIQTLGPDVGSIVLTNQKDAGARTRVSHQVVFRGMEPAAVLLAGDGDTDLDLIIRDQNGNIVASDTDNTDFCYCVWTPLWTGKFTVEVLNLGTIRNTYTLVMATPNEVEDLVSSVLTDIMLDEILRR